MAQINAPSHKTEKIPKKNSILWQLKHTLKKRCPGQLDTFRFMFEVENFGWGDQIRSETWHIVSAEFYPHFPQISPIFGEIPSQNVQGFYIMGDTPPSKKKNSNPLAVQKMLKKFHNFL